MDEVHTPLWNANGVFRLLNARLDDATGSKNLKFVSFGLKKELMFLIMSDCVNNKWHLLTPNIIPTS